MIILSHPTGNANVRAAIEGLLNAGMLAEFHTTIASFQGNAWDKWSAINLFAELKRRRYHSSLSRYTYTHPFFEIGRILATRVNLKGLVEHEKGVFSIDSVYKNLDKKIARLCQRRLDKQFSAVYAYEDGALYSFRSAKEERIKCLYDLPIGYWRSMHNLLEEEKKTHPDWAKTLTGFNDTKQKLQNKDEELRLADHIFAASSFTKKTLGDYPGELSPISVIPYGFPCVDYKKEYSSMNKRKLKLLFVGSLSQRKGIANLFKAVEPLRDKIELTVVGHRPVDDCEALNNALEKHNWIRSLPHHQILDLMQENDVFVFPSLFEGFGLVITEAMSQGTPVITTERTAGLDFIDNDDNGWLVKAGDTTALRFAIENLLANPEKIKKAGLAARETALKRPWQVYGKELAAAIKELN
jgi:glycosyltransferase involved in cell wall biosynthesis